MAIQFFGLTTAPRRTPTPTPRRRRRGSCTATLRDGTRWTDRFNTEVTVTGTNNWTVVLALTSPQTVSSTWNSTYTYNTTTRSSRSNPTATATCSASPPWPTATSPDHKSDPAPPPNNPKSSHLRRNGYPMMLTLTMRRGPRRTLLYRSLPVAVALTLATVVAVWAPSVRPPPTVEIS